MHPSSQTSLRKPAPGTSSVATKDPRSRAQARSSALEHAISKTTAAIETWRSRVLGDGQRPWLSLVPDIGPACEVILADRLLHDLGAEEHDGLMAWIRCTQDKTGAWLDLEGNPDLSLTALGWWARVEAGDDPAEESLVRAARVCHALGGAQRAQLNVRLWLAMSGQIPWKWLPAIPSELWLLPPSALLSPARISPWARAMLTPYLLLARAPARFHMMDARELLLHHGNKKPIPPRLTRPGLAGDLLQALDRTVKLSRKLPRGPLLRIATGRTESAMLQGQQGHGGWMAVRPTILSMLALRVLGAGSDDTRILRGLAYLRSARGTVRIGHGEHAGREMLGQGLMTSSVTVRAQLLSCSPEDEATVGWLLDQEISQSGPWQRRQDAVLGGWPGEAGAFDHLDVDATCSVLEAFSLLPEGSRHAASVWAAMRRATAVLLAMQEPDGSFSRFERGEASVFMRRFPWRDADLLAFGEIDNEPRVQRSARVVTLLADLGLQAGDSRIRRAVDWLRVRTRRDLATLTTSTLAALAGCAAVCSDDDDPLRGDVERQLRTRQQEDGSFGSIVDTSRALVALLRLGGPCVQTGRAARFLVRNVGSDPDSYGGGLVQGLGLTPRCFDVGAGAREAKIALRTFSGAGGSLSDSGA